MHEGTAPADQSAPSSAAASAPAYDLDALGPEQLRARRTVKWTRFAPDVLPMFVAEMDYPTAPEIMAALHRWVDSEGFGYPMGAQVTGLADATAGFLDRRFGWPVDPADVMDVPDVMRGMLVGVELLTAPGDPVIVTTPVYMPFFEVLDFAGRPQVRVPLRDDGTRWGLDLDAIEAAFAAGARAILLCHPHNPNGTEFTTTELLALADIVERHGARVISDEIHAPLVFDGVHRPYAALSPATAAHGFTVIAASKAWNIPGLKCAQIVTSNAADRERVRTCPEMLRYGTAQIGYAGSVAAYAEGEPWLDAVLAKLDAHRRIVVDRVAGWDGVTTRLNEATYLQWLDFTDLALTEEPAAWLAREAKVMLNTGTTFGAAPHRFARLNFATTSALLDEGLARIEEALSRR